MNFVHPFKINKGEATTILVNQTVDETGESRFNSNYISAQISKDFGGFVTTTNLFEQLNSGVVSLDLTADETNADIIVVKLNSTSNTAWGYSHFYIIYTGIPNVIVPPVEPSTPDLPEGVFIPKNLLIIYLSLFGIMTLSWIIIAIKQLFN